MQGSKYHDAIMKRSPNISKTPENSSFQVSIYSLGQTPVF